MLVKHLFPVKLKSIFITGYFTMKLVLIFFLIFLFLALESFYMFIIISRLFLNLSIDPSTYGSVVVFTDS